MLYPRLCRRCGSRKISCCFVLLPRSPCFPFSQLPLELRLEIFEFYALPKEPIVYSDWCNSWENFSHTIYFPRTVGSREFWSLLQVNREARQAVLRGRQAVFDLSLGVRVPGRLNFIDWGRDLFIWRGLGNGVYRGPAIKQPVFAYKIRHLALPCRYAQESLNKPGEMSTEFSEEELARMPAVRCLYLIIDSESFKSDPRKRDINRNDTFGTYDEYASIRGTRFPPRHVPAAVETVIPYTAKSLDGPTSLAWCQDFLQCLTRFQDEMAESVSRLCGRTINCEALVDVSPPRKWANWEDWLASNGPSR